MPAKAVPQIELDTVGDIDDDALLDWVADLLIDLAEAEQEET